MLKELQDAIKKAGSIRAYAKQIGVDESTVRYRLKKHGAKGKSKDSRPIAAGVITAPDTRRVALAGKRFVFTAAQNNTFIHEEFFNALRLFCIEKDAQLYISQFTYNKSGFQNGTKEGTDLWYDNRLNDYILNEAAQVASGLLFCGELDVLPTAGDPLSGFETYCFGNSGIIPHSKVAMKSLPRLKSEDARFLYTTGAVTQRNYIQRKAGQKAEFHHVFGALYVEVDDEGQWFTRQLIADNSGVFYDLNTQYRPDGISNNHEVMAINWGDIHVEKSDPKVSEASWGNTGESMVNVLQPTYQFIHDLTDFTARNHHNIKDPYHLAKTYFTHQESVEDGLMKSAAFLKHITSIPGGGLAVVVESNHHEAFERWLREADIRRDPANAEFFHKSNTRMYQAIRNQETDFDIYEWALNQKEELLNVIFLRQDDSFVICNDAKAEEEGKIIGGIECGIHGHKGPNGVRGSSNSFRSVGRKCNIGHSHSAGIVDGVYTAGVSGLLDMDYNKGPSSWSHSHIVTYQNGKRAIITIKNGKWRA